MFKKFEFEIDDELKELKKRNIRNALIIYIFVIILIGFYSLFFRYMDKMTKISPKVPTIWERLYYANEIGLVFSLFAMILWIVLLNTNFGFNFTKRIIVYNTLSVIIIVVAWMVGFIAEYFWLYDYIVLP